MAIRYGYLNYKEHAIDVKKTLELINLLTAKGFAKKSFDILESVNSEEDDFNFARANILISLEEEEKGVHIFREMAEKGSLEALLRLNDYYVTRNYNDSAIYRNNRYLSEVDSSIVLLRQQSRLYQSKFLWAKSLDYLNIIIKKAPSDEEALQEASKVKGKIAYLRSLRAKRDTIP